MRVHSHATDKSSLGNKAPNPNNSATRGYSLTAFSVPLLPRPQERRAQSSISEQVKWILKRLLAGSRPEISAVARELGLSDRTLQRRIIDDGATFRQLLLEARQELAHEYLNRPEMDVTEVAFLLGYEDSNSFYRAFRTWEGTTPSQLRAVLRRSETRQ